MEEDDDFYGLEESNDSMDVKKQENGAEKGEEPMDEGLESGEEEEESESDVEIVLDKPQVSLKPASQTHAESKALKIEPAPSATPQPTSTQTVPATGKPVSGPQQLGTNYPAVQTSTIDVNADPIYPQVGKPVTQIDIDADLAESTKPWRLPGADQSDYFNYGFDEFSWEMYRQRQGNMASTISTQKAETAQLQQILGMPPGIGPTPSAPAQQPSNTPVPGAPTGPAAQQQAQNQGGGGGGGGGAGAGAMPGMSDEATMMQMFQQAMANGMDPTSMDFGAFMAAMGGGMPGQGGPQSQQQVQQQQGYGQQGGQGGYGGYGNQGGGNQYGGGRGGGGRRGRW